MKKLVLNYSVFLGILILSLFFTAGNAQQTVTVNVPGDFATIPAALTGSWGEPLVDGDNLVIQVAEGILSAPTGNTNVAWPAKRLNVTIQGAGAGKTIQRGAHEERIADGAVGTRWMQLQAGTEGMGGSVVIFKDMTFQYLGGTTGVHGAGAVLNILAVHELEVKFENVVFDNCVGMAVINSPQIQTTLVFENCLFTENVAKGRTDQPNASRGIIHKRGGKLEVRNTTFYSNENLADNPAIDRGFCITAGTNDESPNLEVILENNAFVNNQSKVLQYPDTLVSPVITFEPGFVVETVSIKVAMNNNILIGNTRTGIANDVDVLVKNSDLVTWETSAGNILNKSVRKISETEYEDFELPGSLVDETYTYTDPRINFTMDGNLPELILDDKAIGGVSYSGDGSPVTGGFDNVKTNNFKAYAFNNTLFVKGVQAGGTIEVFSITGSIVARSIARSDEFEMQIT
jgi:hypothetical protein